MPEKVILLVEDNPDDEKLTIRALEKGNVVNKVSIARDGVEALDYLFGRGRHADRDPADLPRVVFLDLKLPFMDGVEVLREIRSEPRTSRLPVVILTSSAEDQDLQACYALGVNSYIVKPVDIDQFFAAIQQVGVYWLILNRPELPA
jgi:two-component system response regulator